MGGAGSKGTRRGAARRGRKSTRTRTRTERATPAALARATTRLRRCQARIDLLKARLVKLEKQHLADRQAYRRRAARAKREFEARLTRMVQEIGQLRYHEARARMLERALRDHGVDPESLVQGPGS
jgi:hypothetical protein